MANMEEASLIQEACDVEPGHIETTKDTVSTATGTSPTSPTSLNNKLWSKVGMKVGLLVAPLALLAYSVLKPSSVHNVHNVNKSGLKTVELTAMDTEVTEVHSGVHSGVKSGVHSTWWDPITQCTKHFQELMDHDLGGVAFGEFDYETQALKMKDVKTAQEAAEALQDPTTNFVHVGKCGFENHAVVWLYPDHTGDPGNAFLLANGECNRLAVQFLDMKDKASCVAVYRVKSPAWGIQALNHFHGPNTITHCVVGGHGSDSTMQDGVLVMSHMIYLSGTKSVDSMALVDTIHTKLTQHATVFLDSCFAGINGIAKMFSEKMPEHWVMGGVVSLESLIKVHATPFDGSPESGPTQVTSEIAKDRVIDPSAGMDRSYGYPQPHFVEGLIVPTGGDKGQMEESKSYYKTGERMVAWIGGKNMGSVTQWLYPSKNGKVLKIGSKVKVAKPFEAFRMEMSGMDALGIFKQNLPEGLEGTVVFLHSIGNAPTSGCALVDWLLPESFQESDKTGGAGQTLGACLTLPTDFQNMEVVE